MKQKNTSSNQTTRASRQTQKVPDNKVHWANMGPIWGWQDPGWPYVSPMNFVIWGCFSDAWLTKRWIFFISYTMTDTQIFVSNKNSRMIVPQDKSKFGYFAYWAL